MDDRPRSRSRSRAVDSGPPGDTRAAELSTWFAKSYGEIAAHLSAHGIIPKGYPFARYHVRTGPATG